MRVLFISANTESINMPVIPIGLCAVASYAKRAGHGVKIVDLMNVNDTDAVISKAISDFKPEVVGISIRNIDDQSSENRRFLLDQAKDVISSCRNLSAAPIVIGGAGYSLFPVSALEYLGADYGIQGEGEIPFLDLINYLEKGEKVSEVNGLYLPGIGCQKSRIFTKNLDLIPLPDVGIIHLPDAEQQDIFVPVQSRRGCPMGCIYCSTAAIEGKITRKRSSKSVVDALKTYVDKGLNRFFFTDNTFNIPSSYAMELCEEIIKSGLDISFRCIFHPVKTDFRLIKKMARAGCTESSIGFESGSEKILKNMNKNFSVDDVRDTSKMLKDCGIVQMGFLLLGGPGETKETVLRSLNFADSLEIEALRVTTGMRIYPDTALSKIAIDEGLISKEDDLLHPRFYIVRGLEEWLRQTVKEWMAERPHWIC